jgi:cytoskeletal protein RodZ
MDDLGRYLQAAREAAGLTLEQLSRETRIPVRVLERLEQGRREGLPEVVFLRGFVQSIARACQADPGPALEILAAESRRARQPRSDGPAFPTVSVPLAGPAADLEVGSRQSGGQVNWTYLAIVMVFVVGIVVALLTVGTGAGQPDVVRRPDVPTQLQGSPLDGGGLRVR